MPKGAQAPGWVLPTLGFGDHHVEATPTGSGRSVISVPMKGSTSSIRLRVRSRFAGSGCDAKRPLSHADQRRVTGS